MEKYNCSYKSIYAEVNITAQEIIEKSTELREIRDKELSEINLFSGCFLHSDKESKRYYHLSRLVIDLGVLYSLLDRSIEYIEELRT